MKKSVLILEVIACFKTHKTDKIYVTSDNMLFLAESVADCTAHANTLENKHIDEYERHTVDAALKAAQDAEAADGTAGEPGSDAGGNVAAPAPNYKKLKKEDVVAELQKRTLEFDVNANKETLIGLLEADDADKAKEANGSDAE